MFFLATKKSIFYFCIAIFIIIRPCIALSMPDNPVSYTPIGMTVDYIFNELDNKTSKIIQNGSIAGNNIVSNSSNEAKLLMLNLHSLLDDERKTLFEDLDRAQQKVISNVAAQLDAITDRVTDNLNSLTDVLSLDVENIFNSIISNKYTIRRVDGLIQPIANDSTGVYRIKIVGTGLANNSNKLTSSVAIWANGQEIKDLQREYAPPYTTTIGIPAKQINKLIGKDISTKLNKISLEIIITYAEKKSFLFIPCGTKYQTVNFQAKFDLFSEVVGNAFVIVHSNTKGWVTIGQKTDRLITPNNHCEKRCSDHQPVWITQTMVVDNVNQIFSNPRLTDASGWGGSVFNQHPTPFITDAGRKANFAVGSRTHSIPYNMIVDVMELQNIGSRIDTFNFQIKYTDLIVVKVPKDRKVESSITFTTIFGNHCVYSLTNPIQECGKIKYQDRQIDGEIETIVYKFDPKFGIFADDLNPNKLNANWFAGFK